MVFWYGYSAFSNLQPILCLQKRIIRNIYHLPKDTNVDQLMSKNGLETVYDLLVYELLKSILTSMTTEHESQLLNEIFLKEEARKPPESLALIPITKRKSVSILLNLGYQHFLTSWILGEFLHTREI